MPKATTTSTTPPCVSGGPPFWDDLLTRPMRRAFYGKPRIVAADGPIAVTPFERARIGHNIHTLVDLLDAIDSTEDVDMEEDNEDCCQAEDRPLPNTIMQGEHEDDEEDDPGEDNGDEREPSLGWTNLGAQLSLGQNADLNDREQGDDLEPDDRDLPFPPPAVVPVTVVLA